MSNEAPEGPFISPPKPPRSKFGVFEDTFFQIRRAAIHTGCTAMFIHFVVAAMAVVGLYQITIGTMFFAECPSNDYVTQYLILLGSVVVLDMVFCVLAMIPMDISRLFFYALLAIRLVVIGLLSYGFDLYEALLKRDMKTFCLPVIQDTLGYSLYAFSVLVIVYFALLVLNILTAVAVLNFK